MCCCARYASWRAATCESERTGFIRSNPTWWALARTRSTIAGPVLAQVGFSPSPSPPSPPPLGLRPQALQILQPLTAFFNLGRIPCRAESPSCNHTKHQASRPDVSRCLPPLLRIRSEEYIRLDTMKDYLWRLEKNRAPHAIEKFGCPKVSTNRQCSFGERNGLTPLF